MIIIDRIENQIVLLSGEKDVLGKIHLKHVQRVELRKSEDWSRIVAPHVAGNQVYMTLPDNECYVKILDLPTDITDTAVRKSVIDKAHMIIPVSVDELAYEIKILPQATDASSRKVLFMATQGKVKDAVDMMKLARATPAFATPRSMAQFEVLKTLIAEEKVMLIVESPDETTSFTLFTTEGPIMTITENSTLDKPYGLAMKRLEVIINTYGGRISGAVLAGKAHTRAVADFLGAAGITIFDAKKILQKRLEETQIEMPSSSSIATLSIIALLGMILIQQQKDYPNLISDAALGRLPSGSAGGEVMPRKKRFDLGKYKPIALFCAVALIVAGAGVLIWNLSTPQQTDKPDSEIIRPVTQDHPEATPTLTPTPTIALDRKSLKVQVLNGNGEVGVGLKAATFLKTQGYENIDTDNADNYDFKTTIVQTTQKYAAAMPAILEDLNKKYTATTGASVLKDSSKYDIVITIGKE